MIVPASVAPNGTGALVCEAPALGEAEVVGTQISLNGGEDFEGQMELTFYPPPTIERLDPPGGPT